MWGGASVTALGVFRKRNFPRIPVCLADHENTLILRPRAASSGLKAQEVDCLFYDLCSTVM